ncbi:MAG TPA: hypothetical protein O0X70_02285 [Methanocorpusculum sp.]|nr:hypothetical protein [Methanocorpusculum sp.]
MKKVILCILLVLAAVIFTAGCTDDSPSSSTQPTAVQTTAQSTATIEGIWYAQDTIAYTDPTYQTTDNFDVVLTFNKDLTGSEKWVSVQGYEKTPFEFSWMKNSDGSYVVFYTGSYPLSAQQNPSKMFTLSYDGYSLMDQDALMYTHTPVHHTPGPTPEPTAVPKYYTDDVEKLRGSWKSTTILEGPSNLPCRLQYDFNKDGTGVEEWICTERHGNQDPGTVETWVFTWAQSMSDSMYGSYIVTVTKHKGGEVYSQTHVFSFTTPDYSNLMDENGVLYLKTAK